MKQVADQLRGVRVLVGIAVFALVAALAIAGCGDSSDANGETSANSGPTITKVALIKRGDAICAKTDDIQQAKLAEFEKKHPGVVTKQKGFEAVIRTAALPPIATEIEELDALGAPKKDEAKMAAIMEGLEKSLRAVENKPLLLSVGEAPFKGPAGLAAKYGFEECDTPA